MRVIAYVEKSPADNRYSCYIRETFDGCGLVGYGSSADEAVKDLQAARDEMVEMGRKIPPLEFSCHYDIWAFFDKYPINVSAMAKRIGINPSLMRQYVAGVRRPGKARVAQIEAAVRDFGRELAAASIYIS